MRRDLTKERCQTRVAIVGAGPIGLELAVELSRRRIPFEILDSGTVGHTISWWAPQTRWFSSNERIAIAGVPLLTTDQSKATREDYLNYLRSVVKQFGMRVHTFQRVVDVQRDQSGLIVISEGNSGRSELNCECVVLAVGGLHHPRRLHIEGEDLPHVDGYLREPHRYFGRKVLIIGGRNSAAEAALRLHHAGAEVSLCYRGSELPGDHIKYWLYPEIRGLIRSGRIKSYFGMCPVRITPTHVELARVRASALNTDPAGGLAGHEPPPAEPFKIVADDVLSLIGYQQDKSLFERIGIELCGESQRPRIDEETMESNVPGVYVLGTAVAGTQSSHYKIFLENCHEHVDRLLVQLTGTRPAPRVMEFEQAMRIAPES